ncbi:hypothetical protein DPMN_109364, partial [Dreissena polymorpha]
FQRRTNRSSNLQAISTMEMWVLQDLHNCCCAVKMLTRARRCKTLSASGQPPCCLRLESLTLQSVGKSQGRPKCLSCLS